jgi:catechol 2,3-dioxygenase-like lactoylglutathione lyase family enzyme
MNIRIAVISLWAEAVDAAAHFYRDVIGLPLQSHFAGNHPHFDLGGTVLTIQCGHPIQRPETEPRFPLVAFSVPAWMREWKNCAPMGWICHGSGIKCRRALGDVPRPSGEFDRIG